MLPFLSDSCSLPVYLWVKFIIQCYILNLKSIYCVPILNICYSQIYRTNLKVFFFVSFDITEVIHSLVILEMVKMWRFTRQTFPILVLLFASHFCIWFCRMFVYLSLLFICFSIYVHFLYFKLFQILVHISLLKLPASLRYISTSCNIASFPVT